MDNLRGLKEILRQMVNADHERWYMLRDAVIAHCEQDAERIAELEAQTEAYIVLLEGINSSPFRTEGSIELERRARASIGTGSLQVQDKPTATEGE